MNTRQVIFRTFLTHCVHPEDSLKREPWTILTIDFLSPEIFKTDLTTELLNI